MQFPMVAAKKKTHTQYLNDSLKERHIMFVYLWTCFHSSPIDAVLG